MSKMKVNRIENTATTDGGIDINTSGNVGIGLTSPSYEFHVKGAGTVAMFEGTGGNGFIGLTDSDDSTNAFIGCDGGSLKFQTAGSGYSDKLVIDNSGKVGIDTTVSQAKLSIYPGTNINNKGKWSDCGLGIGNSTIVGDYSQIGLGYFNAGTYASSYFGYVSTSQAAYGKGDIVFGTRDVTTDSQPSEVMRITSRGDVGIGTTTPYESQWGVTAAHLKVSGQDYGVVHLTGGTSSHVWSHGAGGTGGLNYMAYDGSTHWMTIQPTSGITKMPGVYGNTTSGTANIGVASDGGMYRLTSSIKYKTDVETLEDQYADAILNCRPVWYRSLCDSNIVDKSKNKSDFGYYGFIAEEVAEIDPRLVSWKTKKIVKEDGGWEDSVENLEQSEFEPEGVNYTSFVPLLLHLVKQQKAAIETLEQRLTDAGL